MNLTLSVIGLIWKNGIWNVDHISHKYDPRFLDVFNEYIKITLKQRSVPNHSIAPKDWHLFNKIKAKQNQKFLFER